MRLRNLLIGIFFILMPLKLLPCSSATIFKIFPVGVYNDTIVSVDMHILRYNAVFIEETDTRIFSENDVGWTITSFITKYDKYQNPIETIQVDSIQLYKDSIIHEMENLYKNAANRILTENKDIDFFNPINISFCDFSLECNNLSLLDDDKFVRYEDIDYPVSILENIDYYGFTHFLDFESIPLGNISSIRKFVSNQFELIVVNLQIGQKFFDKEPYEISWDNDIFKTIYEEPIMYHGYGYDIFFTKE